LATCIAANRHAERSLRFDVHGARAQCTLQHAARQATTTPLESDARHARVRTCATRMRTVCTAFSSIESRGMRALPNVRKRASSDTSRARRNALAQE
jgi:hypothetical protein